MMTHRLLTAAVIPLVVITGSLVADAQTERALDSRVQFGQDDVIDLNRSQSYSF